MEQNKSLETDPHKYLQILVFAKEQKGHNATRIVFSTNGAGTGHPHGKNKKTLTQTQTLHLSQKLTQNGSWKT